MELLNIADLYQLPYVVQICENYLFQNVSVTNAAYLFHIADRYHANQLRQYILHYILAEIEQVEETIDFINLPQDLSFEIQKRRHLLKDHKLYTFESILNLDV